MKFRSRVWTMAEALINTGQVASGREAEDRAMAVEWVVAAGVLGVASAVVGLQCLDDAAYRSHCSDQWALRRGRWRALSLCRGGCRPAAGDDSRADGQQSQPDLCLVRPVA